MDDQRETGREMGGADVSSPPANALLLTRMTRAAVLAECVILGLWWAVKGRFGSWCVRLVGAELDVEFVRTEVVSRIIVAAATVGLAALLLRIQNLPWQAIGLRRKQIEVQVLWGVGAALAAHGVLFGWAWLKHFVQWLLWMSGHGPLLWLRARNPWTNVEAHEAVGAVLILWATGAIGEEVLYRGLLLPRLRRLAGRWWIAVLATSMVFGVAHLYGGIGFALSAFLGSMVWCAAFIWSRSLLAVIVAHFLFNSIQYAVYSSLHGAR